MMFKLFAELIAFHLDAQDTLKASEKALEDEKTTAALREQFVAVLGHDLRNPLAAISAGAKVLQATSANPQAAKATRIIENSVRRMTGLIDDVLDFARARLGGAFLITRRTDELLGPTLDQVISELRAAWPERAIETGIALNETVYCDRSRIAQLLSNLLANALYYSPADTAITVHAGIDDGILSLSVRNSGAAIPPELIARLSPALHTGRAGTTPAGPGSWPLHRRRNNPCPRWHTGSHIER